jgi:hypothetical protein
MSHNEQLAAPGEDPSAPAVEYALDRTYPHPGRQASVKGASQLGGTRTMQDPPQLTFGERWAVHATNSQFNALAGATGGFMSGIVTCPLDVIKTKLQAQGGFAAQNGHHVGQPKVYRGLFGTGSVIWKQEGIRWAICRRGRCGSLSTTRARYGSASTTVRIAPESRKPHPQLTLPSQKTHSQSTSGRPSLPAPAAPSLQTQSGSSKPA